MRLTRRRFLGGSLAAVALAGCGASGDNAGDGDEVGPAPDGGDQADGTPPEQCPDDPLAGGTMLGTVAIIDSGSPDFGRLYGAGLDARLMTDLQAVTPQADTIPVDKYYVRTATPDALPAATGWKVTLDGLVDRPVELGIDEIVKAARDQGAVLMECAGNATTTAFGLLSAGRWRGVPIADVLARAKRQPAAARVMFDGYDRHDGPSETSFAGASWIMSFDQLERAGAFLATHLDGEPLNAIHGAPVRLIMPGWYGCTCVKWLQRITLVDDNVAPTFHMLEFAHRVMQDGEPELARDWAPAIIDQAAMATRVEKWQVGDRVRYRVAGILWGGERPTDKLQVRFTADGAWQDVDVCPSVKGNRSWTLWSTVWDPPGPGSYVIACRVNDPSIRQRRLDSGYYARKVKIT